MPLVTAYRYDGPEVNATLATSEARILHEKITEKAYNDEELIRIISTRSKAQLNATFNHYNDQFGNAISKVCAYVIFKVSLTVAILLCLTNW